jgi:hypothetical protein
MIVVVAMIVPMIVIVVMIVVVIVQIEALPDCAVSFSTC